MYSVVLPPVTLISECVDQDGELYVSTIFPVILIGLNGHILEIATAVSLEYTIVDELLQFNLSDSRYSNAMVQSLARIASALHECASALVIEYERLPRTTDATNRLQVLHPQPSPRPDLSAPELPSLKFKYYLDPRIGKVEVLEDPTVAEMRSLFVAEMALGDNKSIEVLVKFAETYCEEAHRLLADSGLAPKLFHCRHVIGDLVMVVMELLGCDWKTMASFDNKENPVLPVSVFQDLEKAVELLSGSGLAHGDLRAANVMIDPNLMHAKVIDFDWACKEGELRYPVNINLKDVTKEWDPEVKPCTYVKMEHDVWALNQALKKHIKDRQVP